jgi:broad specificity phosphatase PhoE
LLPFLLQLRRVLQQRFSHFDALVSSDLLRTVQTAEVLAAAYNLQVPLQQQTPSQHSRQMQLHVMVWEYLCRVAWKRAFLQEPGVDIPLHMPLQVSNKHCDSTRPASHACCCPRCIQHASSLAPHFTQDSAQRPRLLHLCILTLFRCSSTLGSCAFRERNLGILLNVPACCICVYAFQVQQHPGLRERNLGILQGLTYAEGPVKQPEAWAALQSSSNSTRIPGGGESLDDLQQRMTETLLDIAGQYSGGHTLFGTHRKLLVVLYL